MYDLVVLFALTSAGLLGRTEGELCKLYYFYDIEPKSANGCGKSGQRAPVVVLRASAGCVLWPQSVRGSQSSSAARAAWVLGLRPTSSAKENPSCRFISRIWAQAWCLVSSHDGPSGMDGDSRYPLNIQGQHSLRLKLAAPVYWRYARKLRSQDKRR